MILVTGGAGFVGLNVVEQLRARGDDVVVYDLDPPAIDVKFERGDVTQPLDDVFARHGVTKVIHLAAITADVRRDARDPRRIAEVNLIGTINMLEAARRAGALITMLDARAPSHRLYHLGTGAAWSLPQWCELLARRFPAFRWRESPHRDDWNVIPLSTNTRMRFSNRRLTEDLGWRPRFPLEGALDDFLAWTGEHDED